MGEFIGKRVVPRHDGVWDKTKEYEPLVIVLNEENGDSYISRRDVPAGTVLSDEHYWSVCSRFSEQMRLLADDVDADVRAMHKNVEDTKTAMSEEMTSTREAIAENLNNTHEAISQELTETRENIAQQLTESEGRVNETVGSAVTSMQNTEEAMNEAVEQMTARLDANVSASTDADADYAAEVVDARVDGNGVTYPNLGESVRRNDAFLRPVVKPTIMFSRANNAELANLSTATATAVTAGGRCVAVDYDLNYEHGESTTNYIRGRMGISKAEFDEKYAGKKLVIQMYSETDCPMSLGFGFNESMTTTKAYIVTLLLKAGLNEYVLDTTLESFTSKEAGYEDADYMLIHWCFGNLYGQKPENGHYNFRFSCYVDKESNLEKDILGLDSVPYVKTALDASKAKESERSVLAESAVNAGVANIAKSVGADKPKGSFDATGLYTWPITKDSAKASDMGFSVLIGDVASLKGKKLVLVLDEAYPVKRVDMNLGASWGNRSYSAIKSLLTNISGNCWSVDFDTALATVETALGVTDFSGNIYLMLYYNMDWDLTTLADGETVYNRYRFYVATDGLVLATGGGGSVDSEELNALDAKVEVNSRKLETLDTQVTDNTTRLDGTIVSKGKNTNVVENRGSDLEGSYTLEYLDEEKCNVRYTFAKTAGHLYPATNLGKYGELKGRTLNLHLRNASAEDTGGCRVSINISDTFSLGDNPYREIFVIEPLPGEEQIIQYDLTAFAEVYKNKKGTDIPDDTEIQLVLFFQSAYQNDGVERSIEFFWYLGNEGAGYLGTNIALEALHASQAESAVRAEAAGSAVTSQYSVSAGVENIVQKIGSNSAKGTLDDDGVFTWGITSDTVLKTDAGFSLYIGTTDELHGRTVILKREETFPLARIGLNLGKTWGGGTYTDVQTLFTHLCGNYYAAEFDVLYEKACTVRNMEGFEGSIYLMIYGNADWDLSTLTESETVYNRYAVFGSVNGLVYNEGDLDLVKRLSALEKSTEATDTLVDGLAEDMTEMDERMRAVEQSTPGTVDPSIGNVLYGKKYVSCGDSFTQGDFSGWTDENGLSGKNSPVIYDSEWKVYKTYPWWIAKRNNMTLVNEALCGSIMPLSKQYIAYRDDPENNDQTAEGYRNPFSYKRYTAIPEDADYITFWFGINDASNTNLGTIDDTTNETFYGAWNVVLEWLITNRPYAKMGMIVTTGSNANYRNAVREIAKKWGIPYLDMMGDEQTPVIFNRESDLGLTSKANSLRRSSFLVSSTNGHPNIRAHEYMSTFIEAFLRRL